jgi:hypothetical protein
MRPGPDEPSFVRAKPPVHTHQLLVAGPPQRYGASSQKRAGLPVPLQVLFDV